MIHLDFNNIVSFLAGSVLTFVTGSLTIYIKHILDVRADERKITRENTDEIRALTNQLRRWFHAQLWQICESLGEKIVYGDAPYEVLLGYFTGPTEEPKYSVSKIIDRLTDLVTQYAPASSQKMEPVIRSVSSMHALQNALKASSGKMIIEQLIKELYIVEEQVKHLPATKSNSQLRHGKQLKKIHDECKIYEKLIQENKVDEAEKQMKKLVKEFTTYAWYYFEYDYKQFQSSLKK